MDESQRVRQACEWGEKFHSKLDLDSDGWVSSFDMVEAMKTWTNPKVNAMTRKDLEAMTYLLDNYKDICDSVNDEWGRESSGFSIEDLDAFREKKLSVSQPKTEAPEKKK